MRAIRGAALALICLGSAAAAGPIGPEALAGAIAGADVAILGEVHDHPLHHAHQAAAVAAMAPKALVFEMLTPEQAARATPDLRHDAGALAAALDWAGSGWPDFALYAPIFAAAPEAAVYGAAVPRDQARRAVTEGAAAVFGAGDAARFGLDQPLAEAEQTQREADQQRAHCNALPEGMLPGMVAAQRLRDAALARAVVQAMEDTGGPVAVITGTGHARRDQGMPVPLARVMPDLRVVSIGQMEADPGADAPYDHWIVTPPHPRPDPCAAFAPKPASGG